MSRRPVRGPRTTHFSVGVPSQGHSAHVGQMVEFHYRWHPYYGGRFRHEGREDRANGAIIRVEIRPGEIIQVAEWMLDRALCAGMAGSEEHTYELQALMSNS